MREATLFAMEPGERSQRFAFDVLHDEQQVPSLGHDVDGWDNVGVPDAGRQARFVQEHVVEDAVFGQLGMHRLDGHKPCKTMRAAKAPQVHRGHATRRELAQNLVAIAVTPTKARIRRRTIRVLCLDRLAGHLGYGDFGTRERVHRR